MRETTLLVAVVGEGKSPEGAILISAPIIGHNVTPLGVLQILVEGGDVEESVLATIRALTRMMAETISLAALTVTSSRA